jgi:hypothetical protein
MVNAFREMSQTTGFNRSVEVTTKSLPATRERFSLWGQVMTRLTNGAAHLPVIG